MKLYRYKILVITLLLVFLFSCERELDTLGVTKKITYFPVFELEGEAEITVHAGEAFTLPPAVATEQGTEIPVTTSISGTYFQGSVTSIDSTVPDIYTVTYSAVNKDGFAGSSSRTVTVLPPTGDLVTSIEGVYLQSVVRAPGPNFTVSSYQYITKIGPDTYQLSDGIGGYYEHGRGLGTGYVATGATLIANIIPANDFTFGDPFSVGTFGGVAELTSFEVNPVTKTIKYQTAWDFGYTFDVTLTQVEL